MFRLTVVSFCISLLPLLWLPSSSWAWSAFVLWVTDGDSLTVIDRHYRLQRIRVYGIDCPESDQAYGFTARMKTAWEVWMRPVTLTPVEKDCYGRLVARVRKTNQELSAILVSSGLAWVYERYCRQDACRYWERLEAEARKNGHGLWSKPDPIPPWRWRHGERPHTGWKLW